MVISARRSSSPSEAAQRERLRGFPKTTQESITLWKEGYRAVRALAGGCGWRPVRWSPFSGRAATTRLHAADDHRRRLAGALTAKAAAERAFTGLLLGLGGVALPVGGLGAPDRAPDGRAGDSPPKRSKPRRSELL